MEFSASRLNWCCEVKPVTQVGVMTLSLILPCCLPFCLPSFQQRTMEHHLIQYSNKHTPVHKVNACIPPFPPSDNILYNNGTSLHTHNLTQDRDPQHMHTQRFTKSQHTYSFLPSFEHGFTHSQLNTGHQQTFNTHKHTQQFTKS